MTHAPADPPNPAPDPPATAPSSAPSSTSGPTADPAADPTAAGPRRRRRRRIGRGALLTVEILGVVAGLLVIAAGLLALRLSQGPLPLAWAVPHLERALEDIAPDWHSSFGEPVLAWNREERRLDLAARDLALLGPGMSTPILVDRLAVRIALSRLLALRFIPNEVELAGLQLTLLRGGDGRLTLGEKSGAGAAAGGSGGSALPDIALLRRIRLLDAHLTIEDQRTGRRWRAEIERATLDDFAQGTRIEAVGRLILNGQTVPVQVRGARDHEAGGYTLSLGTVGLPLASLADLDSQLAPLSGIAAPLTGTVGLNLASDGALARWSVDAAMTGGQVSDLAVPGGRLVLEGATLVAEGRPDGPIKARGALRGRLSGEPVSLQFATTYDAARNGMIELTGAFGGLRPSVWAALDWVPMQVRSWLGSVDTRIQGKVSLSGHLPGGPGRLVLDAEAGAGTISHPSLPGGAVTVRNLAIDASLNVPPQGVPEVRVARLELGLPAGRVAASGVIRDPDGAMQAEARIEIADLPIDDLPHLWPDDANANTKRWVAQNLSDGRITRGRFDLAVARAAADAAFDLTQLDGWLRLEGARLTYLTGLTPLSGVNAEIRLTPTRADFAIESGTVDGLKLRAGEVAITGLDIKDQQISIMADLAGPVPDALALLDLPRLGYISRFGVQPKSTGGQVQAKLSFAFPLLDKVKLDEIDIKVGGNLSDLRVPKAIKGLDLDRGRFTLDLDGTGFSMTGGGHLAGTQFTGGWREFFADKVPVRRRYEARATLDAKGFAPFGLDLAPYASGPVATRVEYVQSGGRGASMTAALDFTQARLFQHDLLYDKPPGQPANLRAVLDLLDGRLTQARDVVVTGADLAVQAQARFEGESRLAGLEVARFQLGLSQGALSWRRGAGGVPEISLSAGTLDLSAIRAASEADKAKPGAAPARPDEDIVTSALRLRLGAGRIIFGPGQELRDVQAALDHDGRIWRQARLSANLAPGRLEIEITPAAGGRTLRLDSDDAGRLLALVSRRGRFEGGVLRIAGRFDDRTHPPPLIGSLRIDRFRVIDAPVLARLLAFASITGIPELLGGSGISFDKVEARFVRRPQRLEIQEMIAGGVAMGFSVKGVVSGPEDTAQLSGEIVPVNFVNKIIGIIPLIGDALIGGPGGGVIAFGFRINGPLADPDISVNPLTALTPGFLRRIFDADPPSPDDVPPR